MADTKISNLAAAAALVGTEVVPVVQSAATVKASVDAIAARAPIKLTLVCSDETTALTAGTAKYTGRAPQALKDVTVRASLSTAQASGSIFTVDVNENGSSILSTKLTIDNTEKTSTTAATPAVVSDATLADDAEITVDIDQVGDGTAKGLKVVIYANPA